MQKLMATLALGSGLLLAGLPASADDRDWRRDDSRWGRDDSRWGRGDNGGSSRLFSNVQNDLRRAERGSRSSSDRERRRFDNAVRHLAEFESRYQSGRFDKDKLDEAIEDIQNVVDHNSLDGRSQQALRQDLAQLRQFRATRGASGNYGRGGYGYGRDRNSDYGYRY